MSLEIEQANERLSEIEGDISRGNLTVDSAVLLFGDLSNLYKRVKDTNADGLKRRILAAARQVADVLDLDSTP